MGVPGVEGSPKVGEGVVGGTVAAKREMEGREMGKEREVKERSLSPVGWAGLKESRSSS